MNSKAESSCRTEIRTGKKPINHICTFNLYVKSWFLMIRFLNFQPKNCIKRNLHSSLDSSRLFCFALVVFVFETEKLFYHITLDKPCIAKGCYRLLCKCLRWTDVVRSPAGGVKNGRMSMSLECLDVILSLSFGNLLQGYYISHFKCCRAFSRKGSVNWFP